MKKRNLKGSVVVITGAAGGLGKALAFRFAAAGCRLALMDKDAEALGNVQEELRSREIEVITKAGDVSVFEDCNRFISLAEKTYRGIDILINNAGITHRSAFRETDYRVFHRVMEVNYFGAVHCTKASLENLIENRGMIVAISSVAGFAPLLGRTGYSAAKHALHGFFESLRTELYGTGVDILIVCPSFIATDIEKNALGENGKPTQHPQSRVGKRISAEEASERIFQATEKRKRLLILSPVGKLSYLMMKIHPPWYEGIMRKSLSSELERE